MSEKTATRQAEITQQIVAQLAQGTAPWVRPWSEHSDDAVVNAATKRPYSGANILTLWMAQVAGGYPTNRWMSFKQAVKLNASVRKGEHGTAIFYVSTIEKDEVVNGKIVQKRIPFLKSYTVFNTAQIDGLPQDEPEVVLSYGERYENADLFLRDLNLNMVYLSGGFQPRYEESNDRITMPGPARFSSKEAHLSWVFHELGKWSAHPNRLGRNFDEKFKKDRAQAEAFEELVCELGSAFLCADLGLPSSLNHAEYISQWIPILEHDVKAIWSAGSHASKIVTYLKQMAGLLPMPGALSLNPEEDEQLVPA